MRALLRMTGARRLTLPTLLLMSVTACGAPGKVTRLPDDTVVDEGVEAPSEANILAAAARVRSDFPAASMKISDHAVRVASVRFADVDPKKVVPPRLLSEALAFFAAHESKFANRGFISILDYRPSSRTARFYLVNLNTGAVTLFRMAHGRGSDPKETGFATSFGNDEGSHKSSLGFVRTAETYPGAHGRSLRLDGLSDTNSNLRRRAVVVHGSEYVRDADVIQGMSWGCPAVPAKQVQALIDDIKGGSLMYAGQS